MVKEESYYANETKEIEIDGHKYTVGELSADEVAEVREETIKYDPSTGKIDMNSREYNNKILLKGLKNAPFEINKDNIKRLKQGVFTALLKEITAMSFVSEEEQKK